MISTLCLILLIVLSIGLLLFLIEYHDDRSMYSTLYFIMLVMFAVTALYIINNRDSNNLEIVRKAHTRIEYLNSIN
jgi:hypothetical protein